MIGVLDYGMGNIQSVLNAVEAVGYDAVTVARPKQIEALSHLIVPGVGSYRQAMANIRAGGLEAAILGHMRAGKPTLGICLGMQILSSWGSEGGESQGLGVIEGAVRHLEVTGLPVPHVGWNSLQHQREHPIFAGVKKHVDFYFVHSYFFDATHAESVVATADYGQSFAAVVARDNIVGVQFHPEKSQDNGLKMLENFCDWDGSC